MVASKVKYYATGRRKTSIARIWIFTGTGQITVNGKSLNDYFSRPTHQFAVKQPFASIKMTDKFDVYATVCGGGISGQAGAVQHGIARALLKYDEKLRPALKLDALLTRDPRMKERKKYGQAGARKRFQFSKR